METPGTLKASFLAILLLDGELKLIEDLSI
jgi:hypothetical protein